MGSALLQRPLLQLPPLQSESDPQAPHLPLRQLPTLQSESEPQLPHLPLLQWPWPLQSESEPQWPQVPPEQFPYEQSESEPQRCCAQAFSAAKPNTARDATAINIATRFMKDLSKRGFVARPPGGARGEKEKR